MAGDGFKLAAEIKNILIACMGGGFRYVHFSGKEKVLGFADAYHRHILVGSHAHYLLEKHPEMAGAAMGLGG